MRYTPLLLLAALTTAQAADRMAWFNVARFGMFIHWGIYAVPAGEWGGNTGHGEWIMLTAKIPSAEYEPLAAKFNPVKFDADEWVGIAKRAGMKYLVITAKHHDGFSMYDSALTDYDIVDATPYGKDPMKELARACREAGIRLCFYYSNVDWHHPDFPAQYSQRGWHGNPNSNADIDQYAAYMKGQVRELLTNYGPVGIIWFDGGGSFKDADAAALLHGDATVEMIHDLQPDCLINNRLRVGADYGTPEQHIPGGKQSAAFEVCMTLNGHWGYNSHDHNWKECPTVIRNLADIVSKGGNYLLNVGPTAEGLIPPDSVRILQDVGDWMKVNGESIHGADASPYREAPDWGRITVKGNRLFAHVFDRPADGIVRFEQVMNRAVRAYRLGDARQKELEITQDGTTVSVKLATLPDPTDTVIAVEFDGPVQVLPNATHQAADGTVLLHARVADCQGTLFYEKDDKGKDNIGGWTRFEDWVQWDMIVDRPGTYDVTITYAVPDSTAGAELAVKVGGQVLPYTTVGTGSFTAFKTFPLGQVTIDRAGRQTVSVKVTKPPTFAVMNLQAVTLKPHQG